MPTEAQPRPDHEPLFQVFVDENHPVHGKRELAVGPRMCRKYLEPIMEMIGRRIADGTEKASRQPWSNPRLVQVTVAETEEELFTREERQNELVGGYRHKPKSSPHLILH